jgi:hypothetical protein
MLQMVSCGERTEALRDGELRVLEATFSSLACLVCGAWGRTIDSSLISRDSSPPAVEKPSVLS